MARRSPLNERYKKDHAPAGKTRRSAASAKPKRTAAAQKAVQKPARKTAPREPYVMNPPTEEFRKWRRIWWALIIGASVLTLGSLALRKWLGQELTANIVLGLGYGGIFVALYVDMTKLRRLRNEWMASRRDPKSAKAAKSGSDDQEASES